MSKRCQSCGVPMRRAPSTNCRSEEHQEYFARFEEESTEAPYSMQLLAAETWEEARAVCVKFMQEQGK